MKKSTLELQSIVFSGGSIIVDAKVYPASTLQSVVSTAKSHGAQVTIRHASVYTLAQCKSLTISGGGHGVVVFDFTE